MAEQDEDRPWVETQVLRIEHKHVASERCWRMKCKLDRYSEGLHDFTDGVSVLVDEDTDITIWATPVAELDEATRGGNLGEVIDRRVQVYGEPVTGFTEIAEMWSTYLGFRVQAYQVPIMMILMKVVRSKTSPDYSDHSDDIEGYLDLFRTIIGDDMIHARSVNEYIAQKWPDEAGPQAQGANE